MWLIIAFSCLYIFIPYSYIFVHYFLLSPLHSPSAPPLSLFLQVLHLPLFSGFRSLVDCALLSGMPLVNIQVHLYVFNLRSPLVVPSFPYCKGYRQILQPCTGQEVVFFPIGAGLTDKDLIEKLVRCFILLPVLLCPHFFTGCKGSLEGLCYYDQQCSQNWESTLHFSFIPFSSKLHFLPAILSDQISHLLYENPKQDST